MPVEDDSGLGRAWLESLMRCRDVAWRYVEWVFMQIAGTPAGTVMTPEYVAAVGRFAYVWGWPLVNNLNRSIAMKNVPTPGRLAGIVAGQTPPVDGFWSLTLYNKEHLFEPNVLNRFSLGTKSKSMKGAADGSLTIYVQNTSPGADKQDNWMPAPKDNFSLYIRAYWPKEEITSGRWVPPLVKAAD